LEAPPGFEPVALCRPEISPFFVGSEQSVSSTQETYIQRFTTWRHPGVQVGAGAGFRLNTPVGLLRLDFGAPVNPRPIDPAWTVHIGLGHAF
jgi:outer membrane protein assembly factor BamA